MRLPKSSLSLSASLAFSQLRNFGKIIALGLPNGTNNLLSSVTTTLAHNLLVAFGTTAVAAMEASSKISMIVSMVQMGICMGVQPLMAYNYGAKDIPPIKETLVNLSILTISIGLAAIALCVTNSYAIIHLFLKEPAALELGRKMVRLHVLTGPFLGLYHISSNFLQVSGNAKMSILVSMLRQGIFFISLIYVMNGLFGVAGNICTHIAADSLAATVGVVLAVR